MSTVAEFLALLSSNGSDAIYHRDDGATPCPCRTPEGFRDPESDDHCGRLDKRECDFYDD